MKREALASAICTGFPTQVADGSCDLKVGIVFGQSFGFPIQSLILAS